MKDYDVAVIGAGMAGMTAALHCQGKVALIERQKLPGHKILVTGNGRCNLTNIRQDRTFYRSEDPERAYRIVSRHDPEEMLAFLKNLGIYTRQRDGYVYPYSEQALAVREAFEDAIRREDHIHLMTDCRVTEIRKEEDHYWIRLLLGDEDSRETAGPDSIRARAVILATGGLAAGQAFGCDGSGYLLGESLGHHMVPALPALTSLRSGAPFLKKLSGVRTKAEVSLFVDGECIIKEYGELQWTSYGISGIAVFNISRYAVIALNQKKQVVLAISFLPEMGERELIDYLRDLCKRSEGRSLAACLQTILPRKMIPVILREAGMDEKMEASPEADLAGLARVLSAFPLRINGYTGYDKAQTTRGGFSLKELGEDLESSLCPGLFAAGELVDVDGSCGGYNLQWAYSSGSTAGMAASCYIKKGRR